MEELKKERNPIFDIAKGIGICLIVFLHASSPGTEFFGMFHVALFFMISGFFFSGKNFLTLSDFGKYFLKTAKRLWLPYVLLVSLLTVFHNWFVKINIYTNNHLFLEGNLGNKFGLVDFYTPHHTLTLVSRVLYFFHNEQLTGAMWFIIVLFYILIFSALINFLCNKFIKKDNIKVLITGIIYFIFMGLGYFHSKHPFGFFPLGQTFSAMFIFYLGMLYKQFEKKIPVNFVSFIFSFLILLYAYKKIGINMAENLYGSFIGFLLLSAAGFMFVLFISEIFAKNIFIKNVFSYIGKNTMSVLCLHFIAFKFITLIQIHYYNLPAYRLASFPVYQPHHLWWLVYGTAGVALPLLITKIWHKIKNHVFNNRRT